MASIDALKASDGSGNAAVATIQNVRSAGATTLVVDTVQGINDNFYGTMGTPHTFVDPVTGEEITVISEATAVDFKGHVDGTNLEIDTIAPGFADNGSAVGDIVIIKPTTQWADEVAGVLEVSHNDDGTLKNDTVDTNQLVGGSVGPSALAADAVTPPAIAAGTTLLGIVTKTNGNFITNSALPVIVTGMTVTATVPSGVSYVRIRVSGRDIYNQSNSAAIARIWQGTVGSGTVLAEQLAATIGTGATSALALEAVYQPSPGTYTWNLSLHSGSGNAGIDTAPNYPLIMTVEALY